MIRHTAPPVDVARTQDSVMPHRTRRADLYAALSRNAAEQARLYAELAAIEAGEVPVTDRELRLAMAGRYGKPRVL